MEMARTDSGVSAITLIYIYMITCCDVIIVPVNQKPLPSIIQIICQPSLFWKRLPIWEATPDFGGRLPILADFGGRLPIFNPNFILL